MVREIGARMNFEDTLATYFPKAVTDGEFVTRSYAALRAHGFQPMNTFAGVGLCRDELTRPLADKIRETWGRPSISPASPACSS
jgi:hypothetical protein